MRRKLTVELNLNPLDEDKEKFNQDRIILGKKLIADLTNVDISWLSDGGAVISCDDNFGKIKSTMVKHKMKIKPMRNDIKHSFSKGGNEQIDKRIIPDSKGDPKEI